MYVNIEISLKRVKSELNLCHNVLWHIFVTTYKYAGEFILKLGGVILKGIITSGGSLYSPSS